MFDTAKQRFDAVYDLVKLIDDNQITQKAKFLDARMKTPDSYVVLLGETSSGKSTLLNGLMQSNVLHTSVKPSTATVVELCLSDETVKNGYYAINKNATMEELSYSDFVQLSKNPDENLSRLRVLANAKIHGIGNLHLFDTPGYNSIFQQHDEILKDFIFQSNMLIYVVAYKVGIQQADFDFLRYTYELLGDDVELVLVINRAPNGATTADRRIAETQKYVSDLLHKSPKLFIVNNHMAPSGDYPLPHCTALWEYVQDVLSSPKQVSALDAAFNGYVDDLLGECEQYIAVQKMHSHMMATEIAQLELLAKEYRTGIEAIKTNVLQKGYDKIIGHLPSLFEKVKGNIQDTIKSHINSANFSRKDETTAYIHGHLLPFVTKQQTDEILSFYIQTELEAINHEINDRLNAEVVRIEKTAELHFSTEVAMAVASATKRYMHGSINSGLSSYFKQFAGRGGTGIANGASHLLKKLGDLFGKTFSRSTHNSLKHILSKIGATSANALNMTVAVFVEGLFLIVDVATWQKNLCKLVDQSVDKWAEEAAPMIEKDLNCSLEENMQLLDQSIEDYDSIILPKGPPMDNVRLVSLDRAYANVKIAIK